MPLVTADTRLKALLDTLLSQERYGLERVGARGGGRGRRAAGRWGSPGPAERALRRAAGGGGSEHLLLSGEPIFLKGLNWHEVQLAHHGLSRALVLAMVWNQVNHPSVVMGSLHNECDPGTDPGRYREWPADLARAARLLDPQHRPLTWASSTSWDPAFDLADVVGFNE